MKQTIVLTESPPNKASVAAIPGRSDREGRFEPESEFPWLPPAGYLGCSIDLNPNSTFQEVLGFGAALTDAACFLLDKLPESSRKEFCRRSLIQHRSGS